MDWTIILHEILNERFNLNELKTFIFKLEIKLEELSDATTAKSEIIENFISYIGRHDLKKHLSQNGQRFRPDIDWSFLDSQSSSTNTGNATQFNIDTVKGDVNITVNQSQEKSSSSTKPIKPESPNTKLIPPNPFIVSKPVTKKNFFGREKILGELFNFWNDYPKKPVENAAILGRRGSGKTSLLMHIKALASCESGELRPEQIEQRARWLPNPEEYCFIYVDFQYSGMQTQVDFLSYLLKEMQLAQDEVNLSQSSNPLKDFHDVITEKLEKPTIVMLDEIGTVIKNPSDDFGTDLWNNLRSLASTAFEPARLGFLLSSREKPSELQKRLGTDDKGDYSAFFNLFGYETQIKSFSEEEAIKLIKSSTELFPEETITKILKRSLKPDELQKHCHKQYSLLL